PLQYQEPSNLVREALPTEPPRQPSRRSDSHPSGTKAAQTKTDLQHQIFDIPG
ncbi:MAG: hypothetical protein ACI93T_000937, partial [Porticoccaceae bacterium]